MYEVDRMHKVYGPIVRINPEELHVKDPEFHDVLHAGNTVQRDKWLPAAQMAGTTLSMFPSVGHQLHRDRKTAAMPLFTSRAIADAEPMIREQVEKMCNIVHECFVQNKPIELGVLCIAFAVDVTFKHIHGEDFGLLKDLDRARNWRDMANAILDITPLIKQFPWAGPYIAQLPVSLLGLVNEHMANASRLQKTSYDRARKFKRELSSNPKLELDPQDAPPPTLFHIIQQSNLPPHDKSVDRLAHEAIDMSNAGGETISRTLELTIYHILSNPQVYHKLMMEIMDVMPDVHSVVPIKRLKELPWLRAVVKESLRCNALITSRLPLVSPIKPLQFHEWTFSPGTPVSDSSRDIMLNPGIFEEPHQFTPERWLDDAEKVRKLDRYFIPFSKGTRMCIGYQLAYSELYLSLATFLRTFVFELYETTYERDVKVVRDCFTAKQAPESVGIRVKVVKELD